MKKFLYLVCILLIACNNSKTEVDFKLIPVKSGEYWGYIDRGGKFIINPQFKAANPFYESLALVETTDGKYGYINEEGKYIINPQYTAATDFSEGLALTVKENGKLEFINHKGEVEIALDANVESGLGFQEGLAMISIEGKHGFINKEGKIVIPATFESDKDYGFSEGLCAVSHKDNDHMIYAKCGFINTKGELVIPYQFDGVFNFNKNGLAIVANGKKCGFIDKSGKYVINPQFDVDEIALDFENDMFVIRQGELRGYIDKTGKIVINPQFKSAYPFYTDVAAVTATDGKMGFIDKAGKYVINPQFDYCSRFYKDIAIVNMAGKYGLIDKTGKIIVNPQFEQIGRPNTRHQEIQSNFFDVNTVVSYIIENVTDKSFNGFSATTTFKDLKTKYPNLNENNYSNYSNFIDLTNTKRNKYMILSSISPSFPDLTSSADNYTTQQVYDPVAGGYTTQKVYNSSTVTTNPNAKLWSIQLNYVGNMQYERVKILKNALFAKLKEQGFSVSSTSENLTILMNKKGNMSVIFTDIFNTDVLSENLTISVDFNADKVAATPDNTIEEEEEPILRDY